MSDKDLARRTEAVIYFDGVDISASLRHFLISLTYTDNEEDETDDLQIMLADRDDIWLTNWLNKAIEAAASSPGGSVYKVTAKGGVNVRSGPGTNYKRLGAIAYGTQVSVKSITKGWATINYNRKTAYVNASYITPASENGGNSSVKGLRIQAVFVQKNWTGDGKDKILDCGQFELDSVEAGGPPSTISIKGTSLPFSSQVRQTKKSKAWEAYTLSRIANEIAAVNGMACMYEAATDPYYDRVEQISMSDIAFLSQLCKNSGISLKVSNNIIILFDQAEYEAKPAVLTIKRGSGQYIKYRLRTGAADQKYACCRVSYVNPATGEVIQATAYAEDYDPKNKHNQTLEITAKVNSVGEARALAEKMLRLKNKFERTASYTLPGNPSLIAGMPIILSGWGAFDGKYIIKQAIHTIDSSGYTTQIKLRQALEG